MFYMINWEQFSPYIQGKHLESPVYIILTH